MEDAIHHRKRRRCSIEGKKKLLVGDKVEVRSTENGFQGSWHAGVVIACERSHVRQVRYAQILCDDESGFLTEDVEVSSTIDGITNTSETLNQGNIRPSPPIRKLVRENVHYGLCVDAYCRDAWWEGVVFDQKNGSDERKILFPELGDDLIVKIEDLRITQDWDEVTEEWKPRGNWLFLEIIEELERINFIPISVQQIWFQTRERKEFGQIGVWTSTDKPLWQELVVKVINDNMRLTSDEFLNLIDFSEDLLQNGEPSCAANSNLISEANSAYCGDLMMENETSKTMVDDWVGNCELPRNSKDPSTPSSRVVANYIDQETSPQPKACSAIHLDEKGFGESSFHNNSAYLCSGPKSGKNSLHSRRKLNWQPANDELKLKPVFCPQSIIDYVVSRNHRDLPKIRNHLLYLGWKIEYSKLKGTFRYTSPKGKPFYSARILCQNIMKSPAYNSSPIFEKSVVENSSLTKDVGKKRMFSSVDNLFNKPHTSCAHKGKRKSRRVDVDDYDIAVEPEYCPDAIFKYLKKSQQIHSEDKKQSLQEACRQHLAAIGWSFWIKIKKGVKEWRYDSPTTKKTYYSLRNACKAIENGVEFNTYEGELGDELSLSSKEIQGDFFSQKWSTQCSSPGIFRAEGLRNLDKRKKNGSIHPLTPDNGFSSNKRESLSKERKSLEGNSCTRVLRSRKKVRETGPCSSSQVPRTVLSWLIDNNVVLPREKVYYRQDSYHLPMAKGRITRNGINCSCCQRVFTLSGFEAHAGSHWRQPAANLFLGDGRSLVECQMQIIRWKIRSLCGQPLERARKNRNDSWNDHVCSVCHYGGELILCDQCPSSFHTSCLNLQNVPEGDWFCPSCCCGICGESQFDANTEHFTDKSVLCCHQCERQYHAHCIRDRDKVKLDARPKESWLCCKTCEKIHCGLHQLLGKSILVGQNNLTWTLIKPMDYEAYDEDDCDTVTMTENYSKLSVALEVMHECFEPVKEPRTGRDIVEDVIFGRGSHLNRLNFKGFYTVLLERNDELITVATLRVYGDKVAEIPLIGTRFQYRRLGMCRILMNVIEKNLMDLGVEKLVLPAAPSVLKTWTTSFGFSPVTQSERSEFLGCTLLDFQDTIRCQKLLRETPGAHHEPHQNIKEAGCVIDLEGNSGISEVFQEEQLEGSQTVDQGAQQLKGTEEDKCNTNYNGLDPPLAMVTDSTNREYEPCCTSEFTDHKRINSDKSDGNLKFYKRKKAIELRPSITQTDYAKVEVSCR